MTECEAIVIGGGHNGLAAAATLARAGLGTVLVEARDRVGGMAEIREFHPGFRAPRLAHLVFNLNPAVAAELELAGHDWGPAAGGLPTVALAPDGRHVVIDGAEARFVDGAPHPDAARFAALRARLVRFAGRLAPLIARTPPRLDGTGLGEAKDLARLGLDIRRMGKADMREFLRIVLGNARDVILDEIGDGPLAAALAFDAVLGGHVSPRAPGTVLSLMYRLAHGGTRRAATAGGRGVADALADSARAAGAEVRLNARAQAILVDNDRAAGIRLAGGEELTAPLVLSGLDAAATLHLTHVEHFDAEMARRIRSVRTRGSTAKLNLALSAAPQIRGLDASRAQRILVAPTLDAFEAAFDPAKYGEIPAAPVVEAFLASAADPALVDGDGHVLSLVVQHAPLAPKGGWRSDARDRLADAAIDTLETYAPGLRESILAREVLTPQDIERDYGATGGHWHHGELAVDQMLMLRPVNGLGHYALPVEGLYLCGAAAHPGGDLTAVPGRNAARQALADIQARRRR